MNKYRIAFVVPRYHKDLAGGAERFCRDLATNLHDEGHDITVLTTTAMDHHTWKHSLKEGESFIDGVRVLRFKPRSRNVSKFLALQNFIDNKIKIKYEEEKEWINNSINSYDLYEYIDSNRDNYDYFVFLPYLFGLTYNGSMICPEKTILIPCLHNESYAYLSIFKEMFSLARGIVFNSLPEKILAHKLYDLQLDKGRVVGVGVEREEPRFDIADFKKKYNLDTPYMIYLGRKESGKNVHILVDYFHLYRQTTGSDMKLVLIGGGDFDTSGKEGVVNLGFVSEEDKAAALSGSLFLCQPSVNESFSIVIMESWLAKKPVLVHRNCLVTLDHALKSNGGLFFKDYYDFAECLDFFVNNTDKAEVMGQNGEKYTKNNFTHKTIVKRFLSYCDFLAANS